MDFKFFSRFIGRIKIWRVGFEFRSTGVHKIIDGAYPHGLAQSRYIGFRPFPHFRKLTIRESILLGFPKKFRQFRIIGIHGIGEGEIPQAGFKLRYVVYLFKEPGIDRGELVYLGHAHPGQHGMA